MIKHIRQMMLCMAVVLVATPSIVAGDVHSTAPTSIANGSMVVCWKKPLSPAAGKRLLIHFHGSPEAVKPAFARCKLDAVLVVVNFPGLSSAYSSPFKSDAKLLTQILRHASATVAEHQPTASVDQWRHLALSSFSAGYGAVRELLKTSTTFDRIEAIVAADSIYAGLEQEQPNRQVNEKHMRDFLRFATSAADGNKAFIISHSSQRTPYASTTETAEYLLGKLNLSRELDTTVRLQSLQQANRATRGDFIVKGFEGESGQDHLQHLHHIDLLWNQLPDVWQNDNGDYRDSNTPNSVRHLFFTVKQWRSHNADCSTQR